MDENANLPIPFGWYALAYSSELAAGDVQPLNFFDEHQVLFRTEEGAPQVLEAFCPHLGAHLGHGGKVHGEAIACPFHGWQFNGGGECVDVPYAKEIPKRARDRQCLYSYPVRECNRMVWAWYHPRRLPPLFELDEVPELSDPNWSEFKCFDWEINAPIQETGENAVDIAHFIYVHRAIRMPTAKITLEGHRRSTDMTSVGPHIDEEGNIDFNQLVDIHLLSKNCGPGMSTQMFSKAFKTFLMGTVTPISANKMKLRFAFAKPLDISEKFDLLAEGTISEIVYQVGQDIPIWQNKKYLESPILCDGDGPVAKYRRWFSQFYDDPAADDKVRMRAVS